MTSQNPTPAEMLAKMDAEEQAAREKADTIAIENEEKRKALLAALRADDLKLVFDLCKRHNFTQTDLRTALKKKGAARKSTPRKSTARKTTARKSTPRKKAA